MWSNAHKVCFANGGNLHHFCDSAHVRQRGTNKVDVVIFYKLIEVPSVTPFFTRRQRHVYFTTQNRQVLQESLGTYRVFHEKRSKIFDLVTTPYCLGKV